MQKRDKLGPIARVNAALDDEYPRPALHQLEVEDLRAWLREKGGALYAITHSRSMDEAVKSVMIMFEATK
jgi:hypothetical protein